MKDATGWRFDGKAGEAEIVSRRIGRNELSAIQACLAYVDAQREYYAAQSREVSAAALRAVLRELAGPARRPLLADRRRRGAEPPGPPVRERERGGLPARQGRRPAPYHGYYYRILEGQGPRAPGGAYSYLAKNQLVGGFALIAYPASYGVSGVMSFLVNHDGDVYETDLGPLTEDRAKAVSLFDLDANTVRVVDAEDDAPATAQ